MVSGRNRFYLLLIAALFVMFACSPLGCSCKKKKDKITPGSGALTVTAGPQNTGTGGTVAQGQSDVVMLQFNLAAGSAQVRVNSVTIHGSGTGNEVTGVTSVRLYREGLPANGQLDGGDTILTTPMTYTEDNGTITFARLNIDIPANTTQTWMIVYDFSATATGNYVCSLQDVSRDIKTTVGGTPNYPAGGPSIPGGTAIVDLTPPWVVLAIFNGDDPAAPVAGDTITVYFNEPVVVTGAVAADFDLPKAGDSLGTSTVAQGSSSTAVITLAGAFALTIPGIFDPAAPNAGPSGIDVDPAITSIEDLAGNIAEPRDAAGVASAPGVDIKAAFIPDGNPVDGLEANVLEPVGEQSGDVSGYVMIQYFVAATDTMTTVDLAVEYDRGTGYQTATEGTPIFTVPFDPSATGDLKIYVWDSVTDYPDADNDTVTLRFTFDPNTPGDVSDDMIDEVSFVLDNKPQAVCTRPYVMPARKTAIVDASKSWVPGGGSVISPDDPNSYTWTFDSVPGGSALVNADIIKTTPGGQLLALFQPDVTGDYVLNLEVNPGTIASDVTVTTVHAVDPDNTTGGNGGANEAHLLSNADIEDALGLTGTIDMSADWGINIVDEPIMPGNMAYDAGGNHLFFASENNTCFSANMGEYVFVRCMLGRFDTSSLPADVAATSPITAFWTYDSQAGEWTLPYHLSSYADGASVAVSYMHMTLATSGGTMAPPYNLGLYVNAGCDDMFRNVIGYTTDWVEWEQADLDAGEDPPITGGDSADYLMCDYFNLGGRLSQVVRGSSDLTYWLIDHYTASATTLFFAGTHLIECSGYLNDSGGNPTTSVQAWHDGVVFPADTYAFDVAVQLNYGSDTAWVTCPIGAEPGVYYVDLGATVGSMTTPTSVAGYTGLLPAEMVLDELNGYLFVSNRGNGSVNGSVSVIDLDTQLVVAEVNLPGDYTMRELALRTTGGGPALLFGSDPGRDMIHLVYVDYGGGTPVLTCLPSVDTSLYPFDIIHDSTQNVLFVSERLNNSILTADGSTGWEFDHNSLLDGGGNDENADWVQDPVSGDLCMVYQQGTVGGIYFSRTADGGRSWSARVRVDDAAGGVTTFTDPDIAVDKVGTLVVVWADDRAGDLDVYVARSDDGGTTWDGPQMVNTDTDSYDQGNPTVTVDQLCNILVAFESEVDAGGNTQIEMVKTVGHESWIYTGPDDTNRQVSFGTGTFVAEDPDIALSPYAGYMPDVWVVWSESRAASPAGVMYNYTNTTFGDSNDCSMTLDFHDTGEDVISDDTTTDAIHPRCAWDPVSAVLLTVWEQASGSATGIFTDAGYYTVGFGTDVVVEMPTGTGVCANPYIAVDTYGGWRIIAYESDIKNVGVETDVYWETIQQGLVGWDGEGARMNADISGNQTRPLAHVFIGPNSIVTWEDARGANKDFYSKRQ
jgi:hypothetical protein